MSLTIFGMFAPCCCRFGRVGETGVWPTTQHRTGRTSAGGPIDGLGSQAAGTARRDSDIDVAAFFAEPAPASFEVDVPSEVDLVVLNQAPLEIAGRIAMNGALLFDDNPAARIR